MVKSYIPILLIVLLSCCPFLPTKEKSSATVPVDAGADAPQQQVKEEGITLKEAWQLAKPEAQAWAADATPGGLWQCRGKINMGYCSRGWKGKIGSVSLQKMATLKVSPTKVEEFRPLNAHTANISYVLNGAFSIESESLLDSPVIVENALSWAEQLVEEGQSITVDSLHIAADGDILWKNCGSPKVDLVYKVDFYRPRNKRLCLNPYNGEVLFSK